MSILQALLENDGIKLPTAGGAEKSIKCFMLGHDDDTPSMSVNIAKDLYYCHGCKAKGNPYTYLTDVRGCSKKEALRILETYGATSEHREYYQTKHNEHKRETAKARKGEMKQADKPYDSLGKNFNGYLAATYHYYRPDDPKKKNPIIVRRWEEKIKVKDKHKTKKTLLTFVPRMKYSGYWVTKMDNESLPAEDRVSPAPLYGIEEILPYIEKYKNHPVEAKPQVWVVEGEKCRDAVKGIKKQKRPPPCVSPYGGSSRAVTSTDWTPLYGQRVLLIADSDSSGRKFMKAIGRHLHANGTTVRYFLPKGDTGYDIFDALQEDDWNSMMAWITEHGGVQDHEEVQPNPDDDEIEAPPLEDDCPYFTVHGYEGDDIVIQDKETHYMHKVPAKGLTSTGQLLYLAPLDFWRSRAPNRELTQKVKDTWANSIIRVAKNKGAISTNNMKMYELGGAITEEGDVVYNVGDRLLTEDNKGLLTGTKLLLFSGQGREIYLPGPKIRLLDHPDAAKWAGDMAAAVLRYRWESSEDAKSFLGWIVTSLIGGALAFRPMVWMIGDAGTGKTFLLDEVLKKLMGTLLTDVGSGSEAGVAAMSGNASLPFYIDEFEPDKTKEHVISQILQLMRIASGGGQGRVRGTAAGGVKIRRPRFSLLVSSINKPELDSASKSRVVTIKLSKTPVPNWPDVRDNIYASLTNERALGIRTYIIRNTARVVRKAKKLEDRMIERGMDTRTAKTKAALTAGYWLLSDKETEIALEKRKKADNYAPLIAMMSKMIKVNGNDRVLAECLYSAYFMKDGQWSDAVSNEQKELQKLCWSYGFGFIEGNKLYIALNYPNTKQLLKHTNFGNIDVDEYLLNLPNVKRDKTKSGNYKRKRILPGVQPYVVRIPEEIMENIGFFGVDDDYASDEYQKKEKIPF